MISADTPDSPHSRMLFNGVVQFVCPGLTITVLILFPILCPRLSPISSQCLSVGSDSLFSVTSYPLSTPELYPAPTVCSVSTCLHCTVLQVCCRAMLVVLRLMPVVRHQTELFLQRGLRVVKVPK